MAVHRLTKIGLMVVGVFIMIIVVLALLIQVPYIQKKVIDTIAQQLTHNAYVKVSIQKVQISFPMSLHLKKVVVVQQGQDTLCDAEEVGLRFNYSITHIFSPQVEDVYVNKAFIRLKKNQDAWNIEALLKGTNSNNTTSKESIPLTDHLRIRLFRTTLNVFDSNVVIESYAHHVEVNTEFGEKFIHVLSCKANQYHVHVNLLADTLAHNQTQETQPFFDIQHLQYQSLNLLNRINTINKNISVHNFESKQGYVTLTTPHQKHEIRNINIALDELDKDSIRLSHTIDIGFQYQHIPFHIKTHLTLKKNGCTVPYLDIQTPLNKITLSSEFQWEADTLNQSIKSIGGLTQIKSAQTNINEIITLFNVNQHPVFNPQWGISCNVRFDKGKSVLSGLKINDRQSLILKADTITINNYTDITKMNVHAQNMIVSLDSSTLKALYQDSIVTQLMPSTKHVIDTSCLGFVGFAGNVNYAPHQTFMKGILSTNVGTINLDVHYLKEQHNTHFFNGIITTQDINIAQIIKHFPLQKVDADIKFKLRIQDSSITEMNNEAVIHHIVYDSITMTNVGIQMAYHNKTFEVFTQSDHPSIQFSSLIKGRIEQDAIRFNYGIECTKIQFLMYGKTYYYRGHLKGVSQVNNFFKDKKINDFNTAYTLNEHQLMHPQFEDHLPTIEGHYVYNAQNHDIVLEIDQMGFIKITNTPNIRHTIDAIKGALAQYLPIHNKPLNDDYLYTFIHHIQSDIKIKLKNITPFKRVFLPMIVTLEGIDVNFQYRDLNKDLRLAVNVDKINMSTIRASHFNFNIISNNNNLNTHVVFDSIIVLDKMIVLKPTLDYQYLNHQGGRLVINTEKSGFYCHIAANTKYKQEQFDLRFEPSYFVIKNQFWNIQDNAGIYFDNDNVQFNNVLFNHHGQQFYIQTPHQYFDPQFVVGMTNYNIHDVRSLLLPFLHIDGRVSMEMIVHDFKSSNRYVDVNLKANDVVLYGDTIKTIYGQIQKKQYEPLSFHVEAQEDAFRFQLSNLNIDKTNGQFCRADIKQMRLKFIRYFLEGIMDKIDGRGSGNIDIFYRNGDFSWVGEGVVDKGYLSILETQCTYDIKNLKVKFRNSAIEFPNATVEDDKQKPAQIEGYFNINTQRWGEYDYVFKARSESIQIFNTTLTFNDWYHGFVEGKIDLTSKGNHQGDTLNINVTPQPTSQFSFNSGLTKSSDFESLISFKILSNNRSTKIGKKINEPSATPTYPFVMDIKIQTEQNKPILFDLIMDKTNKDILHVSAIPDLQIHYDTRNSFQINGIAEIVDGKYDFTVAVSELKIKKTFVIDNSAKNYLKWSGDPMGGDMFIRAKYTAPKVNVSSLNTNFNTSLSTAAATNLMDIDVFAFIQGPINNYGINFDIATPSILNYSSNSNYDILNTNIQNLKNNPNEMLRQSTYLILFNSFASINQSGVIGITQNLNTNVYNSLSNLLTSSINKSINQMIKLNKVELGINYNSYNVYDVNANNTAVQDLRHQVGFGTKWQLNNKWSLTSDLNFDFASSRNITTGTANTANTNTVQLVPNIHFEYQPKQDGFLRFNLFLRSSYDNIIGGQRSKTGTSISIVKDFDGKQ